MGQARSFGSDALEDVVAEGVHDGHRLAADASVRVDLLQYLVDVDEVALLSPFLCFLSPLLAALALLAAFLAPLLAGLGGIFSQNR